MPESPKTRAEILRVALELFRSQGYDATSLREIAERLGLTKAALYYHFRAKEQIVVELTKPFLDGLSAILGAAREAAREGQPMKTDELLGQYLDLLIAEHHVVSLLAGDPGTLNHPDIGVRGTGLMRAFATALVGADASDTDHIRAACAIGAVNATAGLPSARVPGARDHVLRAALAVLELRD